MTLQMWRIIKNLDGARRQRDMWPVKVTAVLALFICHLAAAQTNFFPLLCCSNAAYTNATISSVTPATVTVSWSGGGVERIPISNLPPELQAR